MPKNLTHEQIAHDLAVAYVNYLATTSQEPTDLDGFFQDYARAYDTFLTLSKNN